MLVGNWPSLSVGLVMITGVVFAVSWISNNQQRPAPRKVMQLNVVQLQKPEAPAPKLPPPKPVVQPKVPDEEETPQRTRVKFKMTDIPPDAPPPSASQPPPGGPLALATEGDGPGDAFGLAGNPGGRSFLGVGGGDGAGSGIGGGGYDPNARYGWYYAQVASRIEQELRKNKQLKYASSAYRASRLGRQLRSDKPGATDRLHRRSESGSGNPIACGTEA